MAYKAKVVFGLTLLAAFALGTAISSGAQRPPFVRVSILADAPDFNLAVRGPYKIFTLKTNELLNSGKSLRKTKVVPTQAGIKIKDKDYKVFGIKIVPQTLGNLYVNNRRFRGELFIIRKADLKLLVINNLDVEEYIKGVLRHEVSHRWPLEVLKAQAVAARTFAVYQIQISAGKDFDVTSDIYSQVYGGKTSETFRTSVAVNRSRGEVLTFRGKIFPAFFHATCAGHTEDANILWNINIPPLRGVECKFCSHSPHFNWQKEISLAEAEDKLVANGFVAGGLENISVEERDPSGRVVKLKLAAVGDNLEISGKDFRQIFDPHFIRSTNFTITKSGDKFKIDGIGWGHGVGMCQWGAYGMSLQGRKYDEILKFYYPGAVIKKLY